MRFVNNILENWDVVMEEYARVKRTIPLPGFDDANTLNKDWRAIALWWNYRAGGMHQKLMPVTTELVRYGPTHRATGWLTLNAGARTEVHNHIDWGRRRIIVHIPTYIPEGDCGFNVGGKNYKWKMGEVFAFDANQNHYGYNNTNEQRSIMVFDFDYEVYYDELKEYMLLD